MSERGRPSPATARRPRRQRADARRGGSHRTSGSREAPSRTSRRGSRCPPRRSPRPRASRGPHRPDLDHDAETRLPPVDRWATFDCYGTLVDWDGGLRRAGGALRRQPAASSSPAIHGSSRRFRPASRASYRQVLIALASLAVETGLGSARGPGERPCEPLPGGRSSTRAAGILATRGARLAASGSSRTPTGTCSRPRCGRSALRSTFDRRRRHRLVQAGPPALGGLPREDTGSDRSRHVHVAQSLFHDSPLPPNSASRPSGSIGLGEAADPRPRCHRAASRASRMPLDAARPGRHLMSSLGARCPTCRTFTAVGIDAGYECHRCGPIVRGGSRAPRPTAWGSGGEGTADGADIPLSLSGDGGDRAEPNAPRTRSNGSSRSSLSASAAVAAVTSAVRARPRSASGQARGRLDRPRRPEHAGDIAVGQRVGNAVQDDPRLRRRRSGARRARRRA